MHMTVKMILWVRAWPHSITASCCLGLRQPAKDMAGCRVFANYCTKRHMTNQPSCDFPGACVKQHLFRHGAQVLPAGLSRRLILLADPSLEEMSMFAERYDVLQGKCWRDISVS
jgi:hypothetical protein